MRHIFAVWTPAWKKMDRAGKSEEERGKRIGMLPVELAGWGLYVDTPAQCLPCRQPCPRPVQPSRAAP